MTLPMLLTYCYNTTVELKSSAQQVDGISNATKTRRVIDVICDQVAVDPNKYDVFITALKDAGE